jgi:ABC-type transporter Mla maintaining outer membrane lipid asymmetry ATPase subunit MlaF
MKGTKEKFNIHIHALEMISLYKSLSPGYIESDVIVRANEKNINAFTTAEISKGYGEPGTHNYRPVLKELNLEVGKGEKVAIVGPSGTGKTTLLNLAGSLDQPEQGKLFLMERILQVIRNRNLLLSETSTWVLFFSCII